MRAGERPMDRDENQQLWNLGYKSSAQKDSRENGSLETRAANMLEQGVFSF